MSKGKILDRKDILIFARETATGKDDKTGFSYSMGVTAHGQPFVQNNPTHKSFIADWAALIEEAREEGLDIAWPVQPPHEG